MIIFICLLGRMIPSHSFPYGSTSTWKQKYHPLIPWSKVIHRNHKHSSLFLNLSKSNNIDEISDMKKSESIITNMNIEYPPQAMTSPTATTTTFNNSKSTNSFQSLLDLFHIPTKPSLDEIVTSSETTRVLKYRSYAKRDAFRTENMYLPPCSNDLAPKSRTALEVLWLSPIYRWTILIMSYLLFPYITQLLNTYVTMTPSDLAEITSMFAPGISILYGTFISITLSILYQRQNKIQTNISTESSIMVTVTRSCLSLFRDDKERMVQVGQAMADQIRHVVFESRGEEMMCLIYSDPYARILELVLEKEREQPAQDHPDAMSISCAKDSIKELIQMRSQRLSEEALALPPTHFLVLSSLTGLILLGYSLSVLPTVSATGIPSRESSILFSVLCTVYTLFYNFTEDLNNPFQGVYQIRRSSTAAHLLQAKWLLVNHPDLKGKISFDQKKDTQGSQPVACIDTPGVGLISISNMIFDPPEE